MGINKQHIVHQSITNNILALVILIKVFSSVFLKLFSNVKVTSLLSFTTLFMHFLQVFFIAGQQVWLILPADMRKYQKCPRTRTSNGKMSTFPHVMCLQYKHYKPIFISILWADLMFHGPRLDTSLYFGQFLDILCPYPYDSLF